MTNKQIIFYERIKLMEQGILNGTGEMISVEFADGTIKEVEMPEQIHTYQTWKEMGYQVKKGEKAIAKFTIWKHTVKKSKDENEEDKTNMFMKLSSFFKMSQLDKVQA